MNSYLEVSNNKLIFFVNSHVSYNGLFPAHAAFLTAAQLCVIPGVSLRGSLPSPSPPSLPLHRHFSESNSSRPSPSTVHRFVFPSHFRCVHLCLSSDYSLFASSNLCRPTPRCRLITLTHASQCI